MKPRIAYADYQAALAERRAVAPSMSGYTSQRGGNVAWNLRWGASARSAAADTLPALRGLRAEARDLVRTEPFAASWVTTKVNRAVGTGLAYSAQPHRGVLGWSEDQAREWKQLVQREFSLWADSPECDWYGHCTFYDLQDLVLRSALESGDCFTILPDGERTATMPYRLRLQVIEADRVGNPAGEADSAAVAGGVRMRTADKPEGFFVYKRHPGALTLEAGDSLYDGDWYDAVGPSGRRRVLHHVKRLRPEQPRGVPDLAPVIQLFRDLHLYRDAEIKAAVAAATIALISETQTAVPDPIEPNRLTYPPGTDVSLIGMEAGSVVGLLPGEKMDSFNPGRPNPNFGKFVDTIVDQLGASSFLGSEMLMKKYSTSYTAARAAFLDAWKHILDLRTAIVVRTQCQPVVETWMAEAVAIGRVPAPGFFTDPLLRWAYTRSAWIGDSQGSINPKDEVGAFIAARDGRLTTNERASWELFGVDWNEQFDVMKAEHDRLRQADMLPAPKPGAAAPSQQPQDGGEQETGR